MLSMNKLPLWDLWLYCSINLIADSDFITVNNTFIKTFKHPWMEGALKSSSTNTTYKSDGIISLNQGGLVR